MFLYTLKKHIKTPLLSWLKEEDEANVVNAAYDVEI